MSWVLARISASSATFCEVLDEANQAGLPVHGTWDFENYFSLETIMPQHCPDLITSLQRRARENGDEMQLMSYNNGLINAHTAREFEAAIRRAISNPAGSGLRDLFGDGYFNMVRPQEMMFTPIHLKLYQACGVDSISLYYSALPFNGFSNFVPPLNLVERYNPLTLGYPGHPGNHDPATVLQRWRPGGPPDPAALAGADAPAQLALEQPQDLLLLIDQDADDAFWTGFTAPAWLKKRFSTIRGLAGLLENVQDLDYVEFTTPGRYLQDHPPVGSISFGQDTADGSFDGLSSWAEKWSNHLLFTGLERARILDLQTRRLLQGRELPDEIQSRLEAAFEARLRLLSTTHFGMAAPVMNLTRERTARRLVDEAMENAGAAFEMATGQPNPSCFSLLDYPRGESTSLVHYPAHPSRSLMRLPLRAGAPADLVVKGQDGQPIPCALLDKELMFVAKLATGERQQYHIKTSESSPRPEIPVQVMKDFIQNEYLRLEFDEGGQASRLLLNGREVNAGPLFHSAVTYAGNTYRVEKWQETESIAAGVVGLKRQQGVLRLPGGYPVRFERELLLAAGLPYLYLRLRVRYPRTPDQGYDPGKAQRLQQAWDNRWQEVLPCEIHPKLTASPRVWKHNYCDHLSSYELDYGRFSKNRDLAEANNQITAGWQAVTDGKNGLLLAQTADLGQQRSLLSTADPTWSIAYEPIWHLLGPAISLRHGGYRAGQAAGNHLLSRRSDQALRPLV